MTNLRQGDPSDHPIQAKKDPFPPRTPQVDKTRFDQERVSRLVEESPPLEVDPIGLGGVEVAVNRWTVRATETRRPPVTDHSRTLPAPTLHHPYRSPRLETVPLWYGTGEKTRSVVRPLQRYPRKTADGPWRPTKGTGDLRDLLVLKDKVDSPPLVGGGPRFLHSYSPTTQVSFHYSVTLPFWSVD